MKTRSVRALKITTLAENSAQSFLLGQWGLSFLLELVDGKEERKKVVFDSGLTRRALLHNVKSLEMDLSDVDCRAEPWASGPHSGHCRDCEDGRRREKSTHTRTRFFHVSTRIKREKSGS